MGLLPLSATTTTVRRQGRPVGRRARATWATPMDFVQKTVHLGATLPAIQDGLEEYTSDKRPGVLVLHSVTCHATSQRSRPKPKRPNVGSALRQCVQHLPASALRVFQHSSANSQHKPRYRLCPFFCAPGHSGANDDTDPS